MSLTPEKLGELMANEACKSSAFSARVEDFAHRIEDQIFELASEFRELTEKELGLDFKQSVNDDIEKYAEYGMSFEGEVRGRIAESLSNILRRGK